MSQNDDELQTPAEVVHGIFQAAQDFCTQTVAGNANYKKVVWPLVEDQLDRYAGIRAAKNGGERTLFWQRWVANREAKITRINGNNCLRPAALVRQSFKECGKSPVAVVQPEVSGTTVRWPGPGGYTLLPIPICNIDRLHCFTPRGDPSLKATDAITPSAPGHRRSPRGSQIDEVRWSGSFSAVGIFALIAECSDGGCRVDHRLLIVCNEAGARPIKIQDKENNSGYQQPHGVDREPRPFRIERARVTCKCARNCSDCEK